MINVIKKSYSITDIIFGVKVGWVSTLSVFKCSIETFSPSSLGICTLLGLSQGNEFFLKWSWWTVKLTLNVSFTCINDDLSLVQLMMKKKNLLHTNIQLLDSALILSTKYEPVAYSWFYRDKKITHSTCFTIYRKRRSDVIWNYGGDGDFRNTTFPDFELRSRYVGWSAFDAYNQSHAVGL